MEKKSYLCKFLMTNYSVPKYERYNTKERLQR